MFEKMKSAFLAFVEDTEKQWEAYKRGTFAPIAFLAPMAIMAAAKGLGKLGSFLGKRSAAKEATRAADAQAQANFESASAKEGNFEDDRIARMTQLASQLKGARALSPEVIAAALKRRASTVRKGATVDQSKGLGWNLAGELANDAGNAVGQYIAGMNPDAIPGGINPNAVSGGKSTRKDMGYRLNEDDEEYA